VVCRPRRRCQHTGDTFVKICSIKPHCKRKRGNKFWDQRIKEPKQQDGLRKGLTETGFVEGRNLIIEYAWTGGRSERLSALAAELVDRHARVIVSIALNATYAAKSATSTIPVIFAVSNDPAATNLVASVNRELTAADEQPIGTASDQCCKGDLDFAVTADVDWLTEPPFPYISPAGLAKSRSTRVLSPGRLLQPWIVTFNILAQ
jgi:ABC transporter substrate binding protein